MTNAADCVPPCPKCRSRKHVYAEGLRAYCCRSCKVCFDDPEEGGDYSSRLPDARLLRQEAAAARRRTQRQTRDRRNLGFGKRAG